MYVVRVIMFVYVCGMCWYVSMYVECSYVYVSMYMCMYMCMYVCMYVCVYMYVCTYEYVLCMYNVLVCICVCMYVVCVSMYVFLYRFTKQIVLPLSCYMCTLHTLVAVMKPCFTAVTEL